MSITSSFKLHISLVHRDVYYYVKERERNRSKQYNNGALVGPRYSVLLSHTIFFLLGFLLLARACGVYPNEPLLVVLRAL